MSEGMHYRTSGRVLLGPICGGYGASTADPKKVKCGECLGRIGAALVEYRRREKERAS